MTAVLLVVACLVAVSLLLSIAFGVAIRRADRPQPPRDADGAS